MLDNENAKVVFLFCFVVFFAVFIAPVRLSLKSITYYKITKIVRML